MLLDLGGSARYIHSVTYYYIYYTGYNQNVWCTESLANWNDCTTNHENVKISVMNEGQEVKLCGTLTIDKEGLTQQDQVLGYNTRPDIYYSSKQ